MNQTTAVYRNLQLHTSNFFHLGVISNETENVDLELTDRERNATAELMFMALLTSQAGRYSCMAEVFPLSSEGTVMLREEFHLVVRSKL